MAIVAVFEVSGEPVDRYEWGVSLCGVSPGWGLHGGVLKVGAPQRFVYEVSGGWILRP